MKTKEERREYQREWYKKNKEKHKDACLKWRAKNGRHYKKCLASWEGVIPKETFCEVCGKPIIFNSGDTRTSIHFDHRHGGEPIQGSPAVWLRQKLHTPEREKIWKECDFGMLCERCNRCLPTENRRLWLTKAIQYEMSTYF